MPSAERFRRSEGLVCSPLGDELLIYDSASGNVHVLNKTAHQIWKWVGAGTSLGEMASLLSGSYAGLTQESADRDVRKIIRGFVESAIITSAIIAGEFEMPASAAGRTI